MMDVEKALLTSRIDALESVVEMIATRAAAHPIPAAEDGSGIVRAAVYLSAGELAWIEGLRPGRAEKTTKGDRP